MQKVKGATLTQRFKKSKEKRSICTSWLRLELYLV